ncbi:conserved hypothetical protein [Burkholderia vietnamiensis]
MSHGIAQALRAGRDATKRTTERIFRKSDPGDGGLTHGD